MNFDIKEDCYLFVRLKEGKSNCSNWYICSQTTPVDGGLDFIFLEYTNNNLIFTKYTPEYLPTVTISEM